MSLLQEDRADCVDILIAEDDAMTRRSLRRMLEQEGYHCAEARTGNEAVELAQQRPPQCVLLDLLPTKDDFEVARRLRADPRTHAAHIYCLTSPTDEVAQAEAAQAGCDAVISKPVDATKLLKLVHQELDCPMEWANGLSRSEAEDLLDWLEYQGSPGQVKSEANQSFAVRCPGFRAIRDAGGHLMVYRRGFR